MSPEKMREFLERICRTFHTVSLDEFVDSVLEGRRLRNAMVLTIDDGYANTYDYAFPVLRDMGLPFAVYVTTGFMDSDRILWNDLLEFAVFTTTRSVLRSEILDSDVSLATTADKHAAIARLKGGLKSLNLEEALVQVESICEELGVDRDSSELGKVRFMSSLQIKELSDDGIVFGGHTVTHPILSRESRQRVREEVSECKRRLEDITGKPVRHFAYPNGRLEDFNEMVIDELKQAGYVSSSTSIHGLHQPGDDPFEIRRIMVSNRWTYEEFETRTSGILKALHR
jgi:peptidoglycan/xylan/chitin deacetylase (PgdA/CDA1 family)